MPVGRVKVVVEWAKRAGRGASIEIFWDFWVIFDDFEGPAGVCVGARMEGREKQKGEASTRPSPFWRGQNPRGGGVVVEGGGNEGITRAPGRNSRILGAKGVDFMRFRYP